MSFLTSKKFEPYVATNLVFFGDLEPYKGRDNFRKGYKEKEKGKNDVLN